MLVINMVVGEEPEADQGLAQYILERDGNAMLVINMVVGVGVGVKLPKARRSISLKGMGAQCYRWTWW